MPTLRLQRHHWNAFIYLGVLLLTKSVSLLLIPLYTRRLTKAEYGLYGLTQTTIWLAPPLISLALSAAYSRFYFDHKDPAARDRTVGGIASWVIGMSLGAGLCAELALDLSPGAHLFDLTHGQLRILLWTCVATALAELPSIHFRIAERAGRFAAYNLTQFFLYAGTTWLLMSRFEMGLTGLLLGPFTAQVAGALFAIAFTQLALRPAPSLGLLREAARYSVPFIPHLIGNTLMVATDRWVLELNGLKDDLGLYTLATQLTLPLMLVASAWNDASSPRLLVAWRDGGYAAARRALPRIMAGFLGLGAATLVTIVLCRPLLELFINVKFRAAFPLVPWIGLGLVVGLSYAGFVNVLTLRKSTRVIPLLTMTAVAVNLGLNWILVPRLGVWGAIVGTGVAYAFRTGLLAVFAARELARRDPLQPG